MEIIELPASDTVKAMLLAAEIYFQAHGYTLTDRNNTPLEIQETSEFRFLCPETAAVMRKRIG